MQQIIPSQLLSIHAGEFSAYGRICADPPGKDAMLAILAQTPAPQNAVDYVASVAEFEQTAAFAQIQNVFFGGMPCQAGYCNGYTTRVDTLEYHRSSEWMLLGTDAVLLLGHRWDIADNIYDFRKLRAFEVPAGTALELFATTLHYSPCSAAPDYIFRSVVVLPQGTNQDYFAPESTDPESRLLTAQNKWTVTSTPAADILHLIQ